MTDSDTTPATKPGDYIIETFNCGPGVQLTGIAAWLTRLHAEGWDLVTCYAVPHPTGNMILHHYVVQKRPEVVALDPISAEVLADAPTLMQTKCGNMVPAPKNKGRR